MGKKKNGSADCACVGNGSHALSSYPHVDLMIKADCVPVFHTHRDSHNADDGLFRCRRIQGKEGSHVHEVERTAFEQIVNKHRSFVRIRVADHMLTMKSLSLLPWRPPHMDTRQRLNNLQRAFNWGGAINQMIFSHSRGSQQLLKQDNGNKMASLSTMLFFFSYENPAHPSSLKQCAFFPALKPKLTLCLAVACLV